jgi:hypothetical protein
MIEDQEEQLYEVEVIETVANRMLYIIAARSIKEARDMAEIGETEQENLLRVEGVVGRELQGEPTLLENEPTGPAKPARATGTLCIDVTYDPKVTDLESVATGIDILLETAQSTPGILEDYGNPGIGNIYIPTKSAEPWRETLASLVEWAAQMGGWEAPCWENAKILLAKTALRAEES